MNTDAITGPLGGMYCHVRPIESPGHALHAARYNLHGPKLGVARDRDVLGLEIGSAAGVPAIIRGVPPYVLAEAQTWAEAQLRLADWAEMRVRSALAETRSSAERWRAGAIVEVSYPYNLESLVVDMPVGLRLAARRAALRAPLEDVPALAHHLDPSDQIALLGGVHLNTEHMHGHSLVLAPARSTRRLVLSADVVHQAPLWWNERFCWRTGADPQIHLAKLAETQAAKAALAARLEADCAAGRARSISEVLREISWPARYPRVLEAPRGPEAETLLAAARRLERFEIACTLVRVGPEASLLRRYERQLAQVRDRLGGEVRTALARAGQREEIRAMLLRLVGSASVAALAKGAGPPAPPPLPHTRRKQGGRRAGGRDTGDGYVIGATGRQSRPPRRSAARSVVVAQIEAALAEERAFRERGTQLQEQILEMKGSIVRQEQTLRRLDDAEALLIEYAPDQAATVMALARNTERWSEAVAAVRRLAQAPLPRGWKRLPLKERTRERERPARLPAAEVYIKTAWSQRLPDAEIRAISTRVAALMEERRTVLHAADAARDLATRLRGEHGVQLPKRNSRGGLER